MWNPSWSFRPAHTRFINSGSPGSKVSVWNGWRMGGPAWAWPMDSGRPIRSQILGLSVAWEGSTWPSQIVVTANLGLVPPAEISTQPRFCTATRFGPTTSKRQLIVGRLPLEAASSDQMTPPGVAIVADTSGA